MTSWIHRLIHLAIGGQKQRSEGVSHKNAGELRASKKNPEAKEGAIFFSYTTGLEDKPSAN